MKLIVLFDVLTNSDHGLNHSNSTGLFYEAPRKYQQNQGPFPYFLDRQNHSGFSTGYRVHGSGRNGIGRSVVVLCSTSLIAEERFGCFTLLLDFNLITAKLRNSKK